MNDAEIKCPICGEDWDADDLLDEWLDTEELHAVSAVTYSCPICLEPTELTVVVGFKVVTT